MIPVSTKEREELSNLEAEFAGLVWVEAATRYSARLHVRGEHWNFLEDEGRFLITTKYDPERVPERLFRFAYLRACDAVTAIRQGHREAAQKKRERSGKKVSVATGHLIDRAKQPKLPFERH